MPLVAEQLRAASWLATPAPLSTHPHPTHREVSGSRVFQRRVIGGRQGRSAHLRRCACMRGSIVEGGRMAAGQSPRQVGRRAGLSQLPAITNYTHWKRYIHSPVSATMP